MKMSTVERLHTLNNIIVDNIVHSGKKPQTVTLSFTPRLLVFQNFKPNEKITAKFTVKNISKAPTYLNMVYKESSYFHIKPNGSSLLSSPFSVEPKSAYLNPNEKIDIKVIFKTMKLGETQGIVHAEFETGEKFRIMISGCTHTVSVELEKQVVRFQDTYNTMIRQQTFKIMNKSNYLLTYMCMKNDCVYYDFEDKVKLATMCFNLKDSESMKATKLVYYDVLSSDEHERVYSRIFFDEVHALVADDTLTFNNTHFSITPIKGKLWPNKATELTITFSPKEVGDFQAIAYLDIDGVSDRVPLNMVGISLPPSIHLNLETLDMDCVYINKNYNYEIVAVNKGHINGVIVYKEVATLFGSHITCSPELHCLRPGDKEIFIISFCNSNQGPYFEEINFVIRGTSVVLKLYLKGEVIYPSLMFSVPCLDFGFVSLGVPKTLELEVINESIVQIRGSVKISSDGPEVSSITLTDYAVTDKPKPNIPQWPREFCIEPCKVEIEPESRVSLKITLTANLIRANQTSLELELEKSDSPPIILPVTFNAMVPAITVAPEINLRACFIDFAYKSDVYVSSNEFWGYFTLIEPEEESTLEVDVGMKEGLIEPNSTICLPVTIKTRVLGPQEYTVRLHLFGLSKPIDICHISGCGVRPIVTCSPVALHWGQIKLLTKSQKTLTLCNDSPVQVNFKASLLNNDGKWLIQPSEGYIEPESETDLLLTLYLLDADSYTNKAVLQLEKVKDILVPLSATGVGTSIVVGEQRDRIFLGRHFTKIPLNCKVIVENRGTRLHSLEWSEYYKAPKNKTPTASFFHLDPKVFKLQAGEKMELSISGLSTKVTTMKEMWYLVGSVEGVNKKELLMECQVTAEFVDPKIEVSSSVMEFRYDFGPYSDFYKLTDYLTLKPVEPLRKEPLHFFQDINKIKAAFNLTHAVEERLEDQEVMKLQILFDTTKHISLKSKVYCDLMRLKFKGHKNKDAVKLLGKINFPNILVLTPRVDFQCLLNGSIESRTIKIQNMTPLLVCYRLQWKKCLITKKPGSKLEAKKSYETTTTDIKSLTDITKTTDSKLREILTENFSDVFKEEKGNKGSIKSVLPSLNDRLDLETSIDDFEEDLEFQKLRMIQKITPMIDSEIESLFSWIHKIPKPDKPNNNSINEVLQLVPHRGLLKPNEVQYIHVIFRPKQNMNVRAILECEVLGGPSETVIVTGQSSDLVYKLNTQKLNFKIRSFHEDASEELSLLNVAQLPFEYKTFLNEPKFVNELEGTILNLVPPEKLIEPEEKTLLKIVVRPGVVGYFKRIFLLEIGHLPHLPIEIFGWGQIPQVYISLQRPNMVDLNLEYGYLAIASLTSEYLEAVNEFFIKDKSEHLTSPLIEKCFEDPDFQQDWHICSSWDSYPSVMDIELAVERMLVINHIKLWPDILTAYSNSSKMGPIRGFQTIPYVIDYGVVITGSTVQCTADIVNYGPIPAKLHLAKGCHIPTWLGLKLCGRIMPGEAGKLEVTFAPTSADFTELEQNLETGFNLEVPYGVTIPIQIKALCAVPYLTSNVSSINFGSVRCGDKIVCSIPLKNVGKPTCIWYVTLRLKIAGANPMMVLESSGKYEPDEGGWLSVAFKPTMEMIYDGLLIFRFHMNPNRMTIPVTGQGILPQVHIIGPNVNFPPTLPWADTTDMYFGFTNPCPFPIELIIAHHDSNWKEEEEIYQLLYRYYNKPEEMLIPAVKPGDDLPSEILNFYKNFKEHVKKNMEDQAATLKVANAKLSPTTAKKATKASAKATAKSAVVKESSPRKFRTEAEIIADEIKRLKEEGVDPMKECLHLFDQLSTVSDTDKNSKGIIIFMHGSPCEEIHCQEMAYSVGKKLNIPTINVDLCIVEALCVSGCPAKLVLMSAIDEMYDMSRKAGARGDSDIKEEEPEGPYFYSCCNSINRTNNNNLFSFLLMVIELFAETEDEFEIIWKKIEFLANNKNVATPRSKAGDRKKKKSSNSSLTSHTALGALGSTTMFHMDLVTELLTDFFSLPKFNRGFVVDSLTSIMLKNASLTLTTVLKCKHNIRNIHLVLCHSDFYKWAQTYEDLQRDNDLIDENVSKVYDETEIQNIIKSFQDMNEEEYENSPAELKSIYVTLGLESRRKKLWEKKGYIADLQKKEKTSGRERSRSMLTIGASDSKKKLKKDDNKGKPSNEYVIMNAKYNDYIKNTYENLINIANNWIIEECDVGNPLLGFNGQILGTAQKKAKKKSELQLHQISEVSFTERGFPLTLIMCPCLQYKTALVNMLFSTPVVYEALRREPEDDILKHSVDRKEFTVLLPKVYPSIHYEEPLKWRYLDELPIKKCECNPLTNLNLLDDSTQDNVLHILSKWHCTCGKKVTSSQTSTSEIPSASMEKYIHEEEFEPEFYPQPLPLRSVNTVTGHSNRLVLQPGDLVRCKYSFNPQTEGTFSLKRYVEVSGWPESRLCININGICDVPRLDSRPKKMFENFVRRTLEDNVYKVTYLDDQKVFEFGPIFIGNNRVYEEQYIIDLRNASLITADVEIEFLEETTVFEIDKTYIKLEPGSRGKVTISAAPATVGVHNVTLLFCVKDNPEIVSVNIACSGVLPVLEILPLTKSIEYGKLLLYRREDDRFIVKNDSILPVLWKIRNSADFVEDFIIAQTSGIVLRHDNQVVPVTYIACTVGVISNKPLIIDIYDSEGRGEPMVIDTLYLSAECYDVMVECAYENPNESLLNYGNVKVNSTVIREMYLLNRGKYNIYYKLKKVKNFPEPTLLRSFEASPECGMLPSSLKLATIEFECTPTSSMNLVNVPAYICSLLDGSKDQVVVAKFPVYVTIASFYNTFTLFPLGELNFHVIAVGSGVMREVILNNTSKCPVTYEIVLPQQYQPDPHAPIQAKVKDNKIKHPPLRCGNFLINNDDNLLAPGTSRTINIQFMATAARKFEETIKFIISDTCPAEAQGVPLRLVGTGAMPTLDFWNLETTFREHLIVKSLSEYKVPEASPHCVFVEDSVTLHFFCVTVNTSLTGVIDLYNNGLVACALKMKLHYQSNSNQDIFSLDKYETHIEPLLHKSLGIIFTPKALQEYRAVLEIKLKLLDNQEQSFKICLIGEGEIPRIQVISPALKHHRMAVLRFPVTCLGTVNHKTIRIKNICSVKSRVAAEISIPMYEERPVFWLTTNLDDIILQGNNDKINLKMKLIIIPNETITLIVNYNPIRKGRASCDVMITIVDNPYEYYTIFCEAEAFMEDVILLGLEMLSMETDLEAYRTSNEGTLSTVSTVDTRKKSKSATLDKVERKRSIRPTDLKKYKIGSVKHSESGSVEMSLLKYVLDLGGCELSSIQRRTIIMVNNSEKVYKFEWAEVDKLVVKPSMGYISPAEEKDLEIVFFSTEPVFLKKQLLNCTLTAISDDSLTIDLKGATWDNRQIITIFGHNKEVLINERYETIIDEQPIPCSQDHLGIIYMVIVYSAMTEYTKYTCTLPDEKFLLDTFIYQTRKFEFKLQNVGSVPLKVTWSFAIDDEYPARLDKYCKKNQHAVESGVDSLEAQNTNNSIKEGSWVDMPVTDEREEDVPSKVTLFSGSLERNSVDTWFEMDLPFEIKPEKDCLKPNENRVFTVTFSPLEAFDFKVRLKSVIDNLDPYDMNVNCKITAKSLIPYVHLDIEESDYLTSGRRKITGVALPPHITVLEFDVLGSGCYKKTFSVINPTSEAYEFIFEMVLSEKPELIPVHCNMLKGYVEGGTSTDVTFTFSPTAPGVYESQWKFVIPVYNLVMNLLVVGLVREPEVLFVPTILIIRNSLVGFTRTHIVKLKNNESEGLKFEFKGNSLCNESGKTPVIVEPEYGTLRPLSETPIKIIYTPIEDGPLSFKIFCSITYMTKYLTLCVNALSFAIKPKVTYDIIGNEHLLSSDAVTNIQLDQTASTYQRTIPFTIKNDGSATFFFDWHYNINAVKKYLQVCVDPKSGHVTPGKEIECILYFTLKKVPVQSFPLTLTISDGPEYSIYLHAEIEKPAYHFSCMDYDFQKCIVNAPDTTYKKNLAFVNDDKVPIILNLNFTNVPELFVDYGEAVNIEPKKRLKIPIFFRPKQVKKYEFKLQFWVNSLCEEIVTIKGEGVPLLYDLFEGCQKSFDLGAVKVGEKIIHQIEVMNHSKVPIDASFIFRDMYPVVEDTTNSEATSVCLSPSAANIISATNTASGGPSRVQMLQSFKDDKVREQIAMDIQNALSSLKVIPNKCKIKPYRKVPLKIQFKPVGMISTLNVQLNMKVFEFERPLVRLSGSATGMSLCFSQNSLQFGRVRKRGCKILKVMLQNKGDFGARFWWQPLISNEFTISPLQGNIAAHTNVTFTITFRPVNHNPFIKVWASCNIENYTSLEIAMYATCVDIGNIQNKTMYLECPVREVQTDHVVVTNPSDDMWLVLSEVSGGPFETLKEFHIEPNSTFNIPIHFKPKTIGKHECQVLFSPLGESALFISLIGAALHPNPNGNIAITVAAKDSYVQELLVYNITEFPESYAVSTETVKVLPDKFEGYFEIKHPDTIKVWGEAAATCRWTFVCYEECEMQLKVMFINENTHEYQFYNITATVSKSPIVDTLTFVAKARESVQKELVVTNPLAEEASFAIRCEKLDCPDLLKISRNSEAVVTLLYSPLVVGDVDDYLEVSNPLVGTYVYKVVLKCLPAKAKDLEYTTAIGSRMPLRLRVHNKTDVKTEFITSVSHPSIQCEKVYTLGPYEKGKLLVMFEPTEIGVQHCKLSFDSPVAGEFVFNIKGKATSPKPQGPFEIKASSYTTITFKNVFDNVRTFRATVDREDFYVKFVNEPIKPKKDIKVNVYLNDRNAQAWTVAPTGCLTIECYDPPEPKVHWTYFLQGIP
ncbi:hypothetical protein evm_001303 [Chilo suppressalis]|nr:hypothetical protein evm_001303 [Chilo suppressalis]